MVVVKILTPPSTAVPIFRDEERSWRCCGNRTATLDRERNVACEVERRGSSVKRRGNNISQPKAYLDLGQNDRRLRIG
jgi:hypothetical protein